MRLRCSAPTRLHFGLIPRTPESGSGGFGAMLDSPNVTVLAEPSIVWSFQGTLAPRAERVCQSLRSHFDVPALNVIAEGPSEHVGLGIGTALGLSLARILSAFARRNPEPEELIALAGRGRRSRIGAHGFFHGGILFDPGSGQAVESLPWPEGWRFAVKVPEHPGRWHGEREAEAFANAPPDADGTAERLRKLFEEALRPSLSAGDFPSYAQALGHWNRMAGEPFQGIQGGCYSDPAVEELIDQLRVAGFEGAGQSSWGPTVYIPLASKSVALRLSSLIPSRFEVVSVAKKGATFEQV